MLCEVFLSQKVSKVCQLQISEIIKVILCSGIRHVKSKSSPQLQWFPHHLVRGVRLSTVVVSGGEDLWGFLCVFEGALLRW